MEKMKVENNVMLEKFVLVSLATLLLINCYLDLKVYMPYRNAYSASGTVDSRFISSQTTYSGTGSVHADTLLIDLISDKKILVYGEYLLLEPMFSAFAKEVIYCDTEIEYANNIEHEWKLILGETTLGAYYSMTSQSEEDSIYLSEMQKRYQPKIYIEDSKVADADELICIVDKYTNIYVIDAKNDITILER